MMERIAPTWAAESWDNVGLLVGSAGWRLSRVLLTIDLTQAVLNEAARAEVDAIVSYHPPIFRPVQGMVADPTRQEGLAAEALSRRIAVYSPHTALDAAPGGTNDTLAALCGLKNVTPFERAAKPDKQCKLVVFVPVAQVDQVAEAIFDAGAGRIGDYEKCSYRLLGEGTFFGTEASDPVIGKRGRLERVEEVRLEVVFPRRRLADVTAAVRRSHPYEEPAFDVYSLEAMPDERIGPGRIGLFTRPVALASLARSLARRTGAAHVVTIGRSGRKLRRGLVCVGAAGTLPFDIPGGGCSKGDVVITGEIRHHDALRYERCGAAAIALGHWASERPVLKPLAVQLRRLLSSVTVLISRADRDPFNASPV